MNTPEKPQILSQSFIYHVAIASYLQNVFRLQVSHSCSLNC